jgi:predicted amidohydrolase YtcJ
MAFAMDRLGRERVNNGAYMMRSLLDLRPMLGSGFPMGPANPFYGIYAAVTRKDPVTGKGVNGTRHGWHKEEALTFDEAMWGFTGAPAYGAYLDGKAGIIKGRAFADWVVLDKPVEEMSIEEMRSITIRDTWVNGKLAYSREGIPKKKKDVQFRRSI